MKDIILGFMIGLLFITLAGFVIVKKNQEQENPHFRCVEYKGQFNPNNCTLYRRIP